tara:strand:- start:811 stop:1242 length:432 start_codon:yes stop_codon:yes gene_type:complete
MLNTHRDLILLFLSNAFVTLFLVHLVKFPHWLTESPKIIDEYYVKDIFVNTFLDFFYIFIYLQISFYFIDKFKITSNVSKMSVIAAVTSTITGLFVFYFKNTQKTDKFFSRFFNKVGYSACIYDIVIVCSVYYIYEYLRNESL